MISNIHTHTCYCDGENTPEEMVLAALDQGLELLGFSGHSYFPSDPGCTGMTPEKEPLYRQAIRDLQSVYGDRITLLTGTEQDFDSPVSKGPWDYRIGSIHYMYGEGQYWPIDQSAEDLLEMVRVLYGGDMLAFVRAYMEKERRMYAALKPDVVGHFDLYRKFNDSLHYLDEENPKYLAIVQDTLHDLVAEGALLELNLGALARAKAVQPYPSIPLLRFLQKEKARLIITTDCHRASLLTQCYTQAVQLLSDLGFQTMIVRRASGFEEVSLP